MARVVGIDHLVFRVKDIERSRRFYDLVLGFLGFKPKYHFADAVGWSNAKTLLWIGEADAEARSIRTVSALSASTIMLSSSASARTSMISTPC